MINRCHRRKKRLRKMNRKRTQLLRMQTITNMKLEREWDNIKYRNIYQMVLLEDVLEWRI